MLMACTLFVILAVAYRAGVVRSMAVGRGQKLHSRPFYHGVRVMLCCAAAALGVCVIVWMVSPSVLRSTVISEFPAELVRQSSDADLARIIQKINSAADGSSAWGILQDYEVAAVKHLQASRQLIDWVWFIALLVMVIPALLLSLRHISAPLRARNQVETVIRFALVTCSTVAVLTTLGIVLSMLGEALQFFRMVSPLDFFFGTEWSPGFSSVGSHSQGEFGLLPLLWGTLMISAIALLIAVPLGLMIAVYLAEYAASWFRNIVKPVIELLAGIPTIVYGFFALVTLGPLFHELGLRIGLDVKATSALTAGVAMGIMIIPFVSSLADDMIQRVPNALRDASLGLGATHSETVIKVVLPAALPGIVGAFLLAASRAIGETMIVVLAAGNSPVLRFNPFEAVSTVTVTIVNQLTGDLDFASPQSLVAFALGLTLFVMTLALNILALYVVRRYREQYE